MMIKIEAVRRCDRYSTDRGVMAQTTQGLHVARREPPDAAHGRALSGKRNRTTTGNVMAKSWSESGTISRTNPVSRAWLRDRRIPRTGARKPR